LGVSSPMAILVGLVEPRSYIGCRFAGNVGSRFHRWFTKKFTQLGVGRPDAFFYFKIKTIITTSDW
jgi:hypothetical protein